MTIVDKLTPTHFKRLRLTFLYAGTGLEVVGELIILNADGLQLDHDVVDLELTAGELSAIEGKLATRLATYATVTGLTEVPYLE